MIGPLESVSVGSTVFEHSLVEVAMSLELSMPVELIIEVFPLVLTFVAELFPACPFLQSIGETSLIFRMLGQEVTLALVLPIKEHSIVFVFQAYDVEITSFFGINKSAFPDC